MKFLKYGISTGACAAAAAKAAALILLGNPTNYVGVPTPIGLRLEIPIEGWQRLDSERAIAWVVKDSGDDIDVTNGLRIYATVRLTDDGKIIILGGRGVGKVTKPGLPIPIGEPAINPIPRMMIREALMEVLPQGKGAEVLIEVPEGIKVAEKTLNPKLGIIGGISILGTTGIVRPYSLKAYKKSIASQIDIALSIGCKRLFLVPGNIGARAAKLLFKASDDAIIQTGDFIGYMLRKAVKKGFEDIVIIGHAGKLVKLAAGALNTHHKVVDARFEIIAAYAGAAGADSKLINKILNSNTTEEAITLLKEANLIRQTFDIIAEKAKLKCMDIVKGKAKVSIIIVSHNGEILGSSGEEK